MKRTRDNSRPLNVRLVLDLDHRLRQHLHSAGSCASDFVSEAIEEKLRRAMASDAAAGTYETEDA